MHGAATRGLLARALARKARSAPLASSFAALAGPTPPRAAAAAAAVPHGMLSKNFVDKFDVGYEKPRPAGSDVLFGHPAFPAQDINERTVEASRRAVHYQETKLGSRGSRRLRAAGLLPGVLYGGNADVPSVPVTVQTSVVERLVRQHGQQLENTIVRLTLDAAAAEGQDGAAADAEEVLVVPRQLQKHPVSEDLLRLNWMRIKPDDSVVRPEKRRFKVEIPLEYVEQEFSPAIKRGGYVNRTRWKLPCVIDVDTILADGGTGLAHDIPAKFEVSVRGLEVRDRVRVSNIEFPPGVRPDPHKAPPLLIVANLKGKNLIADAASTGGDDGPEVML